MKTEQVSQMLVFNSTLAWLRFQYLLAGLLKKNSANSKWQHDNDTAFYDTFWGLHERIQENHINVKSG